MQGSYTHRWGDLKTQRYMSSFIRKVCYLRFGSVFYAQVGLVWLLGFGLLLTYEVMRASTYHTQPYRTFSEACVDAPIYTL